jgi:hypothetical protein
MANISGLSVFYGTVGLVILWSGIKGETLTDTIKGLASGIAPQSGLPASKGGQPITASDTGAYNSNPGSSSSAPGPVGACTAKQTGANKTLGQGLAATMHNWTGAEWTALNDLVMSESGWCNTIQNPTSTAYGIGQFLDSTWATVGFTKTSNPATQIAAMLTYIKNRYGDPIKAWNFHLANGYY